MKFNFKTYAIMDLSEVLQELESFGTIGKKRKSTRC